MSRITRTSSFGHALVIVLCLSVFSAGVAVAEGGPVYSIQVDGLACPFCAYGVEKQLHAIEGVESVATEIKTGVVTITMHGGAMLTEEAAKKAVEDAGFKFGGLTKPEASG